MIEFYVDSTIEEEIEAHRRKILDIILNTPECWNIRKFRAGSLTSIKLTLEPLEPTESFSRS